jgi:hypothetical protein
MDTTAWGSMLAFVLVAGWVSYFVPWLIELLNPALIVAVWVVGYANGMKHAGGSGGSGAGGSSADMEGLPDVQRTRTKSQSTAFGTINRL